MNKKAILVVSFGTSHPDALEKNIEPTEKAIAAGLPDHDLFRAFTSKIIMKKLKERDGREIDDVSAAIERILLLGYSELLIQPTHVLNGEEYDKLCREAEPYKRRFDLMNIGAPLLTSAGDYHDTVRAIFAHIEPPGRDEAIVLMGHGAEHHANSAYALFEYTLRDMGYENVFVGTVEGYPGLEQVINVLDKKPELRRVRLMPLMIVAGEHAKNDMAGQGEDSWKNQLEARGYETTANVVGLGELPGIRELLLGHALNVQNCASGNDAAVKPGILYGIGVGPGDPELLTLKGRRILSECDIIAVPDRNRGDSTALNIVREFVEGKELLLCPTPMTRDKAALDANYSENAGKIADLLSMGKTVAFITLGDPTVYSTYMYIHNLVLNMGHDARLIPGVTSFCAAAARLNTSLCERDERLIIVPASYDAEDTFTINANKVYMKAGQDMPRLKSSLKKFGLLPNAKAVENCGMQNERVWESIDKIEDSGYYSLVIVKQAGDDIS